MAREFDRALPAHLSVDTAAASGTPLTMACWFNLLEITSTHTLMWLGDKDVIDVYFNLQCAGLDPGDPVRAVARGVTGERRAESTAGYSVNTWEHAAGVFTNSTDRAAFLNGGNKGTNAQDATPAGLDRTAIARNKDSSESQNADGKIAEAAIWTAALTDAEIAILAIGFSPLLVRPGSLVAYWPLIRDEDTDRVGGVNMIPINSPTIAKHPRMIYPSRMISGFTPAAAGPPAEIPAARPTWNYRIHA